MEIPITTPVGAPSNSQHIPSVLIIQIKQIINDNSSQRLIVLSGYFFPRLWIPATGTCKPNCRTNVLSFLQRRTQQADAPGTKGPILQLMTIGGPCECLLNQSHHISIRFILEVAKDTKQELILELIRYIATFIRIAMHIRDLLQHFDNTCFLLLYSKQVKPPASSCLLTNRNLLGFSSQFRNCLGFCSRCGGRFLFSFLLLQGL